MKIFTTLTKVRNRLCTLAKHHTFLYSSWTCCITCKTEMYWKSLTRKNKLCFVMAALSLDHFPILGSCVVFLFSKWLAFTKSTLLTDYFLFYTLEKTRLLLIFFYVYEFLKCWVFCWDCPLGLKLCKSKSKSEAELKTGVGENLLQWKHS